jgi:hypothetical protein
MIRSYIRMGSCVRLLLSLVSGWLVLMAMSSQARTTLNVTNFGARGDAVHFFVNTVSNSVVVTTTNRLSSSDIGKVIEIWGAGLFTVAPYNLDIVATITNVINATNIYISCLAGATTQNARAVYGINNSVPFQTCVDLADTNTTILIPAGNYLMISRGMITNFIANNEAYPAGGYAVDTSVMLGKGGITFLGDDPATTTLIGCGAAKQMSPGYIFRGVLFFNSNPVTNNFPLAFRNLTLSGGLTNGLTSKHTFPANPITGDGWDETHVAIQQSGSAPVLSNLLISNCIIAHWRGEALKSTVSGADGYIVITNCGFTDNNASAINFSFSHLIYGCTFTNTYYIMEFYQGYANNPSVFQNCFVSNIVSGTCFGFNGPLTNHVNQPYTIRGNTFFFPNSESPITTSIFQNLSVIGNKFTCDAAQHTYILTLGVQGYQGNAPSTNIVFSFNMITNAYGVVAVNGSDTDGQDSSTYGLMVVSNTAVNCANFASGTGWFTNATLIANTSDSGWLNGTSLKGQWYLDDLSNTHPLRDESLNSGATNTLTYAIGARHAPRLISVQPNAAFALDDASPAKIPTGAIMVITNTGQATRLFTSSTSPGNPVTMQVGYSATFHWTNGIWATPPSPVVGFHVVE